MIRDLHGKTALTILLSMLLPVTFYGQKFRLSSVVKTRIVEYDEEPDEIRFFLLGDELISIKHPKKYSKENGLYLMTYKKRTLSTGQQGEIKVYAKEPIFEYVDIGNGEEHFSKDLLVLNVNEHERYNNYEFSVNRFYLFRRTGIDTYIQIDTIANAHVYGDEVYQLDSNRILIYKNYDYHPMDDSIPTVSSIYNLSTRSFEKIEPEKFKGLYYTNLVSRFIAVNNGMIYKAYPVESMITVSDSRLNVIDTIRVDRAGDHQEQFRELDSLKNIFRFNKKEFIYEMKKRDPGIERIESITMLNKDMLGVIIKPAGVNDFDTRVLLVYRLKDKMLVKKINLDYRDNVITNENPVPNFTNNVPFVMYCEDTGNLIFLNKNTYIKNNKLKSEKYYSIYSVRFDFP